MIRRNEVGTGFAFSCGKYEQLHCRREGHSDENARSRIICVYMCVVQGKKERGWHKRHLLDIVPWESL